MGAKTRKDTRALNASGAELVHLLITLRASRDKLTDKMIDGELRECYDTVQYFERKIVEVEALLRVIGRSCPEDWTLDEHKRKMEARA